jgi:biopolymer transport protein ExbD
MAAPIQSSTIRSEINVTPLVDVCLVLLVIFMMVTPMLRQPEEQVEVPKTPSPQALPENADQINVTIQKGGGIYFDRKQVSPEELSQVLHSLWIAGPKRMVAVRGDRSVPYGQVMEVLRVVRQAGFEQAGLITEWPENPQGRL